MDLATRAVRDHIADPELLGPYRWGAPEAPRVNMYQAGHWPPKEHLVYFLAGPRELIGLRSSTVVLLDERDRGVVFVGNAGSE